MLQLAPLSSSAASPSLADRLAKACCNLDLPAAKAAVADGASVNEKGRAAPDWVDTELPLTIALRMHKDDVSVWLLSRGADPNADGVMLYGAFRSSTATLQLLIDAGGDVNRDCDGQPPLFWAVQGINKKAKVGVLLAQPSLDLTVKCNDKTPEQCAHDIGKPVLADMIAQEVSGRGLSRLSLGSDSLR